MERGSTEVTVESIDSSNAPAFTSCAVAFGRGRLARPLDALIGVGARVAGQPAALFLAEASRDRPTVAGVLTLHVAEHCRRRGVGTRLLGAAEEATRAAGMVAMTGLLADGSPEGPAAHALASRAGWTRQRHVRSFFKVPYDTVGTAPWVARVQPWPHGFEVFPWRSLSTADRDLLLVRQHDPVYFDPALTPFEKEADHTLNSIGLRVRGEVAGWAVSRHLEPSNPGLATMSTTRLFVRPDLQGRGYGAMLLAEHIKGGPAAGIAYAIFSVLPTNQSMLRFIDKRLKPVASGYREIWQVGKALTPAGHAALA